VSRALAAAVLLAAVAVMPAEAAEDLSGTWWIGLYRSALAPANGEPVPFTPAGRRKYAAYVAGRQDGKLSDDTATFCLPDGVVRTSGSPFPFEIVNGRDQVFILYEEDRTIRQVHLAKPRTPADDFNPAFMGESLGRWEGDTLVIETVGFKDRTVLDDSGLPHGEKLKTIERLRLIDGGKRLESVVTIDDPEHYTRPWQVRFTYLSRPDVEIQEYVCGEAHRDVSAVMRGRQQAAPPVAGLPPLQPRVKAADWRSPNPAMARIWGRAPWRSSKQKPGELGRNDGNGAIPSITEGWDDRDQMLKPKPLSLMKAYDAGVSAGTPPPTSSSACDLDGFPAIIGLPNQWQMLHTPDVIYFLYGYNSQVRRVYMNREHPKVATPSWFGTSTGRWDGDTLVIFTDGLTEKSTLNWDGIPHSSQARITERYRLLPDGRLRLDMLIEDPAVLKGPWNVVKHFVGVEGLDEMLCSEDNGDGGAPTE
jgi:hypothetical protein